MNNLVSNKNIVDILSGISDKILADINNKDITEDQKVILTKANNLISNGNGLKILADDGAYKECNPEELRAAISNTDNVFDLFNISVLEDGWESKEKMPTIRYDITSGIYEDKIYVIGGYNGQILNKNECYNITTNTWSTKANMLTARYALTSSVHDGKVYVIGGDSLTLLNKNECYDIATDTWTTKANMLTVKYQASSCGHDGKIYSLGGVTTNAVALNKNECYDIATDTWSSKSNLLSGRYRCTASVHEGKIYLIGGYYNSTELSTNECYDIATDTWSTKTSMLTKRYFLSSCVYKNTIYCLGGYGNNKNECYDISTDTWSVKTELNPDRGRFACCIYENKIYCIGGYTSAGFTSTNMCYTVGYSEYNLILPDTIQNKLDVIKQNGEGAKILSDNGIYIDIPKGYRYMNQQEVDDVILILSNKLNGGE